MTRLFILDEHGAQKINDMIYKLVDAYWEILHSREIDMPCKLDFGMKEVEFYTLSEKLKNFNSDDDLF